MRSYRGYYRELRRAKESYREPRREVESYTGSQTSAQAFQDALTKMRLRYLHAGCSTRCKWFASGYMQLNAVECSSVLGRSIKLNTVQYSSMQFNTVGCSLMQFAKRSLVTLVQSVCVVVARLRVSIETAIIDRPISRTANC